MKNLPIIVFAIAVITLLVVTIVFFSLNPSTTVTEGSSTEGG